MGQITHCYGMLAQPAELAAHNRLVEGSSPPRPTIGQYKKQISALTIKTKAKCADAVTYPHQFRLY